MAAIESRIVRRYDPCRHRRDCVSPPLPATGQARPDESNRDQRGAPPQNNPAPTIRIGGTKSVVRRIHPANPDVDWNTDPTAIPYLLYQINKRTDLPVFINNEGLDVGKDDLFENTVVYLTSHRRWSLNEKETAKMALFLKRGGTLWLDDCYPRLPIFRQRPPRSRQDDARRRAAACSPRKIPR